MEFQLIGKCILTLSHKEGEPTSKLESSDFNLDVSNNIARAGYLDDEEFPTEDGSKCLTETFVYGIIGNIHYAAHKGFMSIEDHVEMVCNKIREGAAKKASVSPSIFPDTIEKEK